MKEIRIDNSKQSAVKSGKWKNPGSSFYYKILNSFTIADPNRSEEEPGRYEFDFRKILQEAYLIAPVEKIKNSPYGITPYSQSGCKYPHHVIRNGKLVVSIPGIQAAYARAKQQGIYKGKVKEHIDRHYKEMGLTMSAMTESVDPIQDQIDLNFDFIQKYIESALGVKFVHDDVMMESVDDIVDKEQYIKETFDWMDEILYESDDEYNRKIDEENEFNQLPINNKIDDYEFIESVIDAKKELLLAASQLDENAYDQFIDEITMLIEMQESHGTDLIQDEINTDYMGLIQYDDIPNKIMHDYYDEKSEYDPMLNGFLKSYALYEKSHGSLKYEYRIGVDVATGRLVAVEFLLDPKRIRSLGNQDDDLTAYFSKHPEEKAECKRKVELAMHLLSTGNREGCDKLLKEVDEYTNELREKLFNSRNYSNAIGLDKEPRARVDTLKKFIKKIGHIDYVADATVVHAIFYHGGQSVPTINNAKSVTMVPTLSSTISNFINYLEEKNPTLVNHCKIQSPANYNLNNDPTDLTISLVKLFNDLTARKEFVAYIKTNGIRGENYTVGTVRGFDKFRSTKILWDSVWLYRKFSKTPVLRGFIPNKPIQSTTKLVNIYGDIRPYQYDPLKRPKFLKEDAKYFANMDVVAARSIINKAIDQYRHMVSFDSMNEKSCKSNIEEIDFEEKYSAIDATESEWNEFWSLFERGELYKTKSQMINYYNQYLEYIESIGNPSSDETANAHQYKEKIDEMRSDPEYDSWMHRMDLDDMLYAEHRLSQLKPISDEEFIKELLENKAGMLALTDPDDTELLERYQNEIAYLIDCKLNPSVALDKDAINWEYLNLIRYGMNEAVNVDALMRQTSNFIENHFSTAIIHYQDIALPYLLKSYILYERTSTIPDVKYSYRMGIDVDTGKLVAIKFKLEPDKITKVGNAAGHLDAYLSKHPEERRQYEELNQKLNQFKRAGNSDAAKKIEHQLKVFEDKVEANANHHKFLNKDGKVTMLVDTLKNVITRTGHIDFVSGDNEIVGIIYRDGKAYTMKNGKGKKVRILPAQSEQVGEFLGRMRNYDPDLMQKLMMRNPSNYIPRNQDDGQVISLTAAFADPKVQNPFISFVKQFHYQPEVYEIGKTCGPNKYQSTRVLWNNLLLYRKLGDTPQFRGPILDLEVKSINKFNPKTQKYDINYTGLGSPEFIKKESYESGNLNTIIADIKTNIKKYEEGIQEYSFTPNQFNMDLSSYLEADDQSEENDQVEEDDTPPNIDLGDEEIASDEPPTIDTDDPEPTEEDPPTEDEPEEDPKEDTTNEAPNIIEPTSLPKAADAQESDKNGVNRKKLYIAFIEWAKSYNARNTFGSLFDKDVFDVTYPFVPHEMRYFYRLANPILCVLSGKLTFFQVSELRKLNADNPDMKDALIFAATEDDYRAFSTRDKRVYLATDKPDGSGIQFTRALADSFDLYLQNMIGKGDILHGDVDSSTDSGTDRGDHSDENGE